MRASAEKKTVWRGVTKAGSREHANTRSGRREDCDEIHAPAQTRTTDESHFFNVLRVLPFASSRLRVSPSFHDDSSPNVVLERIPGAATPSLTTKLSPDMHEHWLLERDITFLNHGSFGATPIPVLAKQTELRAQLEREPVRFMVRELEPLLDDARRSLAAFLGADEEGLAFVPNATTGVNAVLRSLDLDKHDELLVTTHEYNASRNTLDYVAGINGAKVVCVDIPFPIASADDVVTRVLERVTERTRLLLIDHITSQTALILPVARLVAEMSQRGIDTLIDGA